MYIDKEAYQKSVDQTMSNTNAESGYALLARDDKNKNALKIKE